MSKKQDPLAQRKGQIGREIEKLTDPKNRRFSKDFKSPEQFESWCRTVESRLEELRVEMDMLGYPEGFNECPLAIAAQELGLTLSEMQWITSEGLVEVSSAGYYRAGDRLTREELGRAIDAGPEELLRRAQMDISEIFAECLGAIAEGEVAEVRRAFERIERRDSCINPFALACEAAIHFLECDLVELQQTIAFILKRDFDDSLAALHSLCSVMRAVPKASHILEVIREQVLAVGEGTKVNPFRYSFSTLKATVFNSKLTENQNMAILIGDLVMESVEKYRFLKSLESSRVPSDPKKEEIQMLVQNAAYTALEAVRTYDESPSSKMFVDRYVGVRPTRRKPPELLVVLPKAKTR